MTDVASYGVEERCNRLQVIQPDSVALTSRSGLISQVGGVVRKTAPIVRISIFLVLGVFMLSN